MGQNEIDFLKAVDTVWHIVFHKGCSSFHSHKKHIIPFLTCILVIFFFKGKDNPEEWVH